MCDMPTSSPNRLNIMRIGRSIRPTSISRLLMRPRLASSAIQPKERTTRLSSIGKITSMVSASRMRGPALAM